MAASAETREGDWQCPNPGCINHTEFPAKFVYACKVNCPKCGTGKTAQRPGDWCCPNPGCVNHQNCVYGSKMQCTKCGCARPALNAKGGGGCGAFVGNVGGNAGAGGGVPQPRVGDWHCPNESCKNHRDNIIFANKTSCPICGMDKPEMPAAPRVQQTPVHQQWAMAQPQQRQFTPMARGGGGAVQVPVAGLRPGDWHCPNASCKNHTGNVIYGSKDSCPLCGTMKSHGAVAVAVPAFPMAGAGLYCPPTMPVRQMPMNGGKGGFGGGWQMMANGQQQGRPGDWHCPNPACKNHQQNVVYGSKTSCPICGAGKPPVAPIPSVPGLRPGDWLCPNPSCKNHTNGVYASKTQCTICGMVNPNADDRTRSRSPRH